MMDLLHAQGSRARVIVFSSHILEEVERLSGMIQVIVGGRLAASGDFRAIRRLMTNRPHVFLVPSSDDRALGAALIGRPAVSAVELTAHGLQVRASPTTERSPGKSPGLAAITASGCAGPACGRVAGKRLHLPAGVLMTRRHHGRPPGDGQQDDRTAAPGLLNTDIIRLTLRATIGRKRALLFALPAVILIGISALLKATTKSPLWPPEVLGTCRLPDSGADRADRRRQRPRRRDRRRQHRAPAGHAGEPPVGGTEQVRWSLSG